MIHSKIERTLAGFQAGMLGGVAMLIVLALVPMLDRRGWWSNANLVAACFYGARTIGAGLGWPTVAGSALELLIASIGGAVFGAAFGRYSVSRRVVLLGLFWGLFVFFATEQFYRLSRPVVLAYMQRSAFVVAHMVYGFCLAAISRIGVVPSAQPAPRRELIPRGTLLATPGLPAVPMVPAGAGDTEEQHHGDISTGHERVVQSAEEQAGPQG